MIRNYIKTAWRNLKRNRIFSLINIFGLTIGISVCLVIFLFVTHELSFDRFHQHEDRIYRVVRIFDENGSKKRVPWLSPPYAEALKTDFRGIIEDVVRVRPTNALVSLGVTSFNEKKVFQADVAFFSFFSFPLVAGDPATALSKPASVVLTESAARKYFGDQDPMGKVLEVDRTLQMTVTGIARDIPSNSHLDFDIVVPLSNYEGQPGAGQWIFNSLFTYVLLDGKGDPSRLERVFPSFVDKHMGAQLKHIGMQFKLGLTPLSAVYFEPSQPSDPSRHGDKTVVHIFLAIAFLIVLIACINFINLSTIKAIERSKEVGLRKVVGAVRNHLIGQFLGESVLFAFLSCLFSVGLVLSLQSVYEQLLGYRLSIPWNEWYVYWFIAGIVLVVGFLAGSYPAFVLSSFAPVQALRGRLRLGRGGVTFRQVLVTLQFSISLLLIIGMFVITRQLQYMRDRKPGYHAEHVVAVRMNDNADIFRSRYRFKDELRRNASIQSVSLMSGEPGGFHDKQTFEVEGKEGEIWSFRTGFVDFEYVTTLRLQVIAGRDFSAGFPTDTTEAALINRTAAKTLGYTPEQAVGRWILNTLRDNSRRRIVGVVEDFNYLTLKETMEPLVIAPNEDVRVALVALRPGNIPEGMAAISRIYRELAPGYPFEYTFLDQNFERLYRNDIRQQRLIGIFSALSIFVACLGLYGLASFTATRRIKEVGIRKVLGASVGSIVTLLSKDFVRPVLLAMLVASPVAWWVMSRWLEKFAYRIEIRWWMFVFAGLTAMAIALLTVSWQAVRAAVTNPVDSLKDE